MTDIGPLEIRRDTFNNYAGFTPINGEPFWKQDIGELVVGDGVKLQGRRVMGDENYRRLMSNEYGGGPRAHRPEVNVLWDLGKFWDPDAGAAGEGWSTKQGWTIPVNISTSPWNYVCHGRIPAGMFVSGSWIDFKMICRVFADSTGGGDGIGPRFGLVWDADGTEVSQSAIRTGYHCPLFHDTGTYSENLWTTDEVYEVNIRIYCMGYLEHMFKIETCKLYQNTTSWTGNPTALNTVWTNGPNGNGSHFEHRVFRHTDIDFSEDHELWLGAHLIQSGSVSAPPANDLRIMSTSAVLFCNTGGCYPDLYGGYS